MFDVIWRLYLKGPKIIIVDDHRYEICIGIFLLVLDANGKQAQLLILRLIYLSHAWC